MPGHEDGKLWSPCTLQVLRGALPCLQSPTYYPPPHECHVRLWQSLQPHFNLTPPPSSVLSALYGFARELALQKTNVPHHTRVPSPGVPLGDDDGLALELSLRRGISGWLDASAGGQIQLTVQGTVMMADACGRRTKEVDGGSEGILVRGTWFFVRSNGTVYPYSEEDATQLEEAFALRHHAEAVVEMGGGRTVRPKTAAHNLLFLCALLAKG